MCVHSVILKVVWVRQECQDFIWFLALWAVPAGYWSSISGPVDLRPFFVFNSYLSAFPPSKHVIRGVSETEVPTSCSPKVWRQTGYVSIPGAWRVAEAADWPVTLKLKITSQLSYHRTWNAFSFYSVVRGRHHFCVLGLSWSLSIYHPWRWFSDPGPVLQCSMP